MRVEIGIQDGAGGRYWSCCSDIMKVFESGLHVKWMLEGGRKNEAHLTSISSPQPVKNCFFFGLSTPYRLCQSQKGHKEPPRVPPVLLQRQRCHCRPPTFPPGGLRLRLRGRRPCANSAAVTKEKKKIDEAGRRVGGKKSRLAWRFSSLQERQKKEKKKDGRVADPPPLHPNPGGTETCRSQTQKRAERVRCPTMLTRLRVKTKVLEEAGKSGNPARETERFLKPGKFGIILEIHLENRPWVCEWPIAFKRTNQMCCYQFTTVATA